MNSILNVGFKQTHKERHYKGDNEVQRVITVGQSGTDISVVLISI